MKKIIFTLVFASVMTTLTAQTETEKSTKTDFNKWSVEVAGGVNKAQRPWTQVIILQHQALMLLILALDTCLITNLV